MKILETKRLNLRKWYINQDLQTWTSIISDPRVMKYFPSIGNKIMAAEFIENANKHIDTHGYGLFACELKENSELIGFVGINIPSFQAHFTPCVEIAWRLSTNHWYKGLATEAAIACLELGFKTYHIQEIVAFTTTNNLKSRRVMEKIGMTYNQADDFNHPLLSKDHLLCLHVLYRITNPKKFY